MSEELKNETVAEETAEATEVTEETATAPEWDGVRKCCYGSLFEQL